MPGFIIGGTGGGGEDSSPPYGKGEIKRTYRWIFGLENINAPGSDIRVSEAGRNLFIYLESCTRPSVTFSEIQQHHNQEVIYHEGKTTWQPCSLVFYDMENPDVSAGLWNWVTTQVNDISNAKAEKPSNYKKDGSLQMLDAYGESIEKWIMYNAWPTTVDWQGLSYSSDDAQKISVTLRYDRAVKVS